MLVIFADVRPVKSKEEVRFEVLISNKKVPICLFNRVTSQFTNVHFVKITTVKNTIPTFQ